MTNDTNTKNKKSGWVAIVLIIVLIVVIVSTCSDDGKEPVADTQAIEKVESYPVDSLVLYLNDKVNLPEGASFKISEFDAKYCTAIITVPEETGKVAADVVGKGFCILMTKWLSEKGYTVGHEGIYTSCHVRSPYVGVTGKEDMVTLWGSARYNANNDSVEWEWKKKE